MKKILLLVALFATMFSANSFAQKLVASDVKFTAASEEEQEQVEFSLAGFAETPLPAIAEFVITLPEGFSFKEGRRGYENVVKDGIAEDHSVTINKRANGDFYVLLSDMNGYEFYEPNGFLISLTMLKDASVAEGEYTANIHHIVIDDVTGKIHLVSESEATIKILVSNTVGINDLTADGKNAPVYNTAGQRVTRTSKGLYIQNGRKVVVK